MIVRPLQSLCVVLLGALPPLLHADETAGKDPDLLRFNNGDTLHGSFQGMDDAQSLVWAGSAIKTPIKLKTSTLRQVALNGGRATKGLEQPAYVGLVNGDRIPGRVVNLDENTVTIDTPIGKALQVERKFVASISPNPYGGALHYMGPFGSDEWTFVSQKEKDAAEEKVAEDKKEGNEQAEKDPWVFAGDAWHSNGQVPIAIDADTPDQCRIAFRLAWRNRLSAAVAFHATMKMPEPKEAEEDEEDEGQAQARNLRVQVRAGSTSTSSFPRLYGHSYVMTLYSSYAMLYRCDFEEDGSPQLTRLSHSSTSIRLDEANEAEFELRCDRANNTIALFANGEYVNQWEDPEGYAGLGSHLAFACQSSNSHLRFSDIVVSSWNGMVDSARSMDSQQRDTILLNNGTDRFSGHISGIEDGSYLLKGTYAEMQIPATEVEEIRFARDSREELPDESGKAVRVVFHPTGRLTIEPTSSTSREMTGQHPALGDLKFDIGYARLLQFSFSDSILDEWDENF